MQSSTAQVALQRLVTGNRCEVHGCYEMALWLVSFKAETCHWCAKHTRVSMRDSALWGEKLASVAEA